MPKGFYSTWEPIIKKQGEEMVANRRTKGQFCGIIQTADLEEAIRVLRIELARTPSSIPIQVKRVDYGEDSREHASTEYEVWAWRE